MRQLASMLGMTELAPADIHPPGQRCAVGLSCGGRQVTHTRVVVRCDTVLSGYVTVTVTNEGATGHEPLKPRLYVVRKPFLPDVVAVLIMSEIQAAA